MKITTLKQLDEFGEKLKNANIDFPSNANITVTLNTKTFNKIIPKEFRNTVNFEYNTMSGIRFYLIKRK